MAKDYLSCRYVWNEGIGNKKVKEARLWIGGKFFKVLFNVPIVHVDEDDPIDATLPLHLGANKATAIAAAAKRITDETVKRYGESPKEDAIKYTSWNAWIPQKYDRKTASLVGNAHESSGWFKGWPAFDTAMDYYNNSIGEVHGSLAATERSTSEWIDYMEIEFTKGNLMIWIPDTEHSHQSEGILRLSDGSKFHGS